MTKKQQIFTFKGVKPANVWHFTGKNPPFNLHLNYIIISSPLLLYSLLSKDAQAENAGHSFWSERCLKVHGVTPLPPRRPHPSCASSIPTYIAKDQQHTATQQWESLCKAPGLILNAAFFLIFFFLTLKLPVQPTQPQPLCWKSFCSRTFSCLCRKFCCWEMLQVSLWWCAHFLTNVHFQ